MKNPPHPGALKIQRMSDLEAEMRKVARGEITAPPDAALPSVDSTEALDRNQSGIVPNMTLEQGIVAE